MPNNAISLPIPVTVKKIINENYRTKTYVFDQKIKAELGQFVMIWLPEVAEKPFGIANSHPLTVTIVAVGKCTQAIHERVKVGDKLWYRGPFGKGFSATKKGKQIIIGGGYGVVSLFELAKNLSQPEKVEVIIGARNKSDLLYVNRFKKLGMTVTVTTDDGSAGIKGFTTQVLTDRLTKQKISQVYACGPEIMLEKVAQLCDEKKVPYQVSLEAMMKCGFGVCGACSKHGQLVCIDGPVFNQWPEGHV